MPADELLGLVGVDVAEFVVGVMTSGSGGENENTRVETRPPLTAVLGLLASP